MLSAICDDVFDEESTMRPKSTFELSSCNQMLRSHHATPTLFEGENENEGSVLRCRKCDLTGTSTRRCCCFVVAERSLGAARSRCKGRNLVCTVCTCKKSVPTHNVHNDSSLFRNKKKGKCRWVHFHKDEDLIWSLGNYFA